jgi:uncharacterized protein (TIGR03083 family)
MREAGPIVVVELFPKINLELIGLLSALGDDDWSRATSCKLWSVKDIALHLLDGDIRRLSFCRDKHSVPTDRNLNDWNELVSFINELNQGWINTAQRMSSRMVVEFLKLTGQEIYDYFKSLDPYAHDGFPVRWVSETRTPNWLDIAREYTEKWHHQQQIRDAVGKPGLTDKKFFGPVLDTFVRALPYTFRKVDAAEGASVQLSITGDAGGNWFLTRKKDQWVLVLDAAVRPDAEVVMDQDTAWRLFTKGITKEQALAKVKIIGHEYFGNKVLDMISVVA